MAYDAPNYTQTPNLLLDEHLPDMTGAECKVVLAIVRQTFGWHKDRDQLSISQFEKLTGLSRQGVIDGLSAAMDRGIVDRETSGQSYEYWLVVKNSDQERGGVVKNVDQGSQNSRPQVVKKSDTQKKGKETPPKESAPAREEMDEDPVGVQIWEEVTGERPTIQTRDMLKETFTGEDGPSWNVSVFRDVLKEAYLNVEGDAHRIRLGYLLSSYEKELKYRTNTTDDGKPQGDGATGVKYNPRGYPIRDGPVDDTEYNARGYPIQQ